MAIIGDAPPEENRPGHDLTYQATLGLVSPPEMPRTLIADLGGAEEAVSTALSLLLARERTGVAGFAQVSLAQAAARFALAHQHGLTLASGLLGGAWPGYNLYRTADGWIAVAALEPHFAERLTRELAAESFTHEPHRGPRLPGARRPSGKRGRLSTIYADRRRSRSEVEAKKNETRVGWLGSSRSEPQCSTT